MCLSRSSWVLRISDSFCSSFQHVFELLKRFGAVTQCLTVFSSKLCSPPTFHSHFPTYFRGLRNTAGESYPLEQPHATWNYFSFERPSAQFELDCWIFVETAFRPVLRRWRIHTAFLCPDGHAKMEPRRLRQFPSAVSNWRLRRLTSKWNVPCLWKETTSRHLKDCSIVGMSVSVCVRVRVYVWFGFLRLWLVFWPADQRVSDSPTRFRLFAHSGDFFVMFS